jgi:nucleoside-diphosphate-sugar epimerase
MRVAVFGAGGFIGSRLAARLASEATLAGRALDELVLFDQHAAAIPPADIPVTAVRGDVRDAAALDALFARPFDAIFHLAATLTLAAETDFRRGLETNVLAFVDVLERCRAQPRAPLLLFASSISTFGGSLPPVVDDDLFQAPATSYGTHKLIAEQLLADASRHGHLDARALRLPIVLTHPGPPSGSISDQVASLIREPLRGQRTTCRIAAGSRIVVASVDNVVASFLNLAGAAPRDLHAARTMNLPGLTVTPAEIVEAVARVQPRAATLVDWAPDAAVQRIIDGWPQAFTSQRALALGLRPDISIDAIVRAFQASEGADA